MNDPEESLNFRLKRNQFNNRVPVQLLDAFEEFGDDRKYLLEYLIWITCKNVGTKFATMQEWEVAMLEKYFSSIKAQLKAHPTFGQEFATFFQIEQDLEQRMKEVIHRKARASIERHPDE
ncbi:MAG: hypothetical protein GYA24_18505 [Candidatus Lokiarchaeota archaeon]|nr:hypothetical protein [Candidatus Lokiarchaeota archaeon]